jgi:transmembrane sensor
MTMPPSTDVLSDAMLQTAADWHFRLRAAPQDMDLQSTFESWLAQDLRHAEAWLLAQRAWSLAGETGAMVTPVTAAAPATRRHRSLAALALAACLALLLLWPGIGWWGADYSTGTAQTRNVALADGSTLLLDAGSAADTVFDATRRSVTLLRGEAYFAVAPDAARPFTVRAGELSITVTGTAFSVGLTERSISVALAHGSVKLQHEGRGEEILLRPGERVEIERGSGAVQTAPVDPAAIAAWRNGRLAVQDVALGDVVAAIRRHHRGLILIPDETLLARKVTGVFDLQDVPRALQTLAGPYGARVDQYSPYVIVFNSLNPPAQKN